MKYRSTRGKVRGLSFEEALCTGFASDGGMLLPEIIPVISQDTLKEWAKCPDYKTLVSRIVPYFVGDEIPATDLEELIDRTYSKFTHPDIVPLKRLSDGLVIAEMFHGPTWSFKDYAMLLVGQFMEYFLSKSNKHLTLLIGTSGDTGSSAIAAARGLELLDVIVLLPRGRCSKIQELQMTTVLEDNVHVYRVDGCSDDMDEALNKIYGDTDFVKQYNIGSLNSVNWARIMVQIVHYFYVYLQMEPNCEREVEIVIPTGACGNVTAGCIARRMGLPIKLVCAVGENDVFHRLIQTGNLTIKPYISTIAPAIDIQMPYNLERLWSLVTDGDSTLVDQLMTELSQSQSQSIDIPQSLLDKMRDYIRTFRVTEDLVKATIKSCYEEENYTVCPHTAVAVAYHYNTQSENPTSDIKQVVLATASPKKFSEALKESTVSYTVPDDVRDLCASSTRYVDLERDVDWAEKVREKILQVDGRRTNI